MEYQSVIHKLEQNTQIFKQLFIASDESEYLWKQEENKWCLLEVLCHLYDEEIEDFRLRVQWMLESPEKPPPPFDPIAWIKDRNYMGQNFPDKLHDFIMERERSVQWLKQLGNDVHWESGYMHPDRGLLSAGHYLVNWLAHDYLHIRQILGIKFRYLSVKSDDDLNYSGGW